MEKGTKKQNIQDTQCEVEEVEIEVEDLSETNLNYTGRSDFERFIIRKLQYLITNICSLETELNDVLEEKKKILEMLIEREKINIFDCLPLKNDVELNSMESKLNNDYYRNQMIKQLAPLTGRDIKTSFLNLMKQIVSNEVAILYSWQGAKEKENFSKLRLCQVIKNVIRNAHEQAKDDEISTYIKRWLSHAKKRIEKEKSSQEKDQSRNSEEYE